MAMAVESSGCRDRLGFGDGDIELAASCSVPVLITGETPVERASCARLVHEHSRRQRGPFVAICCRKDRRSEKADPPDKDTSVEGALARARGGTAFIDEIGAMTAPAQRMLFTMMESGEVGARIISGTSRPLSGAVADGSFLEPLFYRLNVIHLCIGTGRVA